MCKYICISKLLNHTAYFFGEATNIFLSGFLMYRIQHVFTSPEIDNCPSHPCCVKIPDTQAPEWKAPAFTGREKGVEVTKKTKNIPQ